MTVTHPYFPARPGSSISYYRSKIQAKYFPDTMDLQLTAPPVMISDGSPNPFRRTAVEIKDSAYPVVAAIIAQNNEHVCPPDWDMWCNSFYAMLWQSESDPSEAWIGESGGMQIGWFDGSTPQKSPAARSSIGFPPEPYLPMDIDAYHTPISRTTSGYTFSRPTGRYQPVSLDWKFKNWGRGPGPAESWEWGDRYPYQIRTVCEERPGTRREGNNVFMVDWAKGVGPICMWQGQINPDLSISGGLMCQIAGFVP